MNNEGALILPDVTSYSKATVIKITRYDTGIDIDKSSIMYGLLINDSLVDCVCL